MKWETRLNLLLKILLWILLGVGIGTGMIIGWELRGAMNCTPLENRLERKSESRILEGAVIIEENSLKAHRINYVYGRVLGSLGEGVPTRIITGYNAVLEQTDDTPFITASGLDLRETDKQICASNEFSFGRIIEIKGLGICEIQDRTNDRYDYRIDWLFETEKEALNFGRRVLEIEIVSN